MSFFKDFKEDFAQAMNELMPESNEMYDENEEIEEDSSEKESKKDSGADDKKKAPAQKKEPEKKKEGNEALVRTPSRPKKQVPLKQKVTEKSDDMNDLDIAPEDLTDQIDDMLDQELYGDDSDNNNPQILLNDDMEVNTMDMSVDELLSQITEKQEMISEPLAVAETETIPEPVVKEDKTVETAEPFSEKDMGLEALLDSIASKSSVKNKEEKEEAVQEQMNTDVLKALQESIEKLARTEEMKNAAEQEETEESTEAVAEEINEPDESMEETAQKEQVTEEIIEPEAVIEERDEPEEIIDEEDEPEEAAEEIIEPEAVTEEPDRPEVIPEETEEPGGTAEEEETGIMEEMIEQKTDEPESIIKVIGEPAKAVKEEAVTDVLEELSEHEEETEPEEIGKSDTIDLEKILNLDGTQDDYVDTEGLERMTAEAVVEQGAALKEIEDNIIPEENEMSEEKDVISINSVEQAKEEILEAEKNFNVDDADTETTYITKGTKIKGDLETDGSIDIIGAVEGNITCQGKVVVGGTVTGNITSGELYANNAKIQGDIKSYGSVKVGVGSMIIGTIAGESAVIAGAVNGDIDVQGPVIVDSTAVIMGNIKSRSVQINNGAVIEGFCSQSYSDIDVKSFFA